MPFGKAQPAASRELAKRGLRFAARALAATVFFAASAAAVASAQGILTVTPARTTTTLAGTGTASSATLAAPSAVAYDASGNLYIADTNNHVIRELVKATGATTTVAGTGVAGFSGDGSPAVSAQLDTPTGIAVDASGNLLIADSHNQRIRVVAAGGTISTLAGNGTKGFSGDNAPATAAALNLPSAVAVDANGNVYIADTNNQRIRRVSAGTITTIAGSGDQGFSGDGAAATAATLDSPTGIAVDAGGNVYIADRHNQRIRMVASGAGAIISTLAGSGTPTFAGGFSGEGASSAAATLAKPTGVSVDASGNVYIADTNNQRIRQLGGGVIATVAGSGQQGFGADGGPSISAILNAPKAVAADASGNLALADTLDQRVRSGTPGSLTFTGQPLGIASAPQAITVSNTGTAAITVSSVTYTGAFGTFAGTSGTSLGNCGAVPFTLAAGASCAQNVSYTPTAVVASSGSVVFGGSGVIHQTVLLTGTGAPAATTTTVASSLAQPIVGQSITFTAQVKPAGAGTPTGTLQFYANGVAIGTPVQVASSGFAALTTSFPAAGTDAISAVYSGDVNFAASTSIPALTQTVADYALSPAGPSGTAQTVPPGQTATFNFLLTPQAGVPFPYPITFTASGQPSGSVVTFIPATVTPGAASAPFTMTIAVPAQHAGLHRYGLFGEGTAAMALLLMPLLRRRRRLQPLAACGLLLLGGAAAMGLAGCGSGGVFATPNQTYNVTVTATATTTSGLSLTRTTTVALTVE